MSTWFLRILLLIVSCFVIAQAYPSSMSNHKSLQDHFNHHPHGPYETSSDNIETDFYENNDLPIWLTRSRKFCCAPPL